MKYTAAQSAAIKDVHHNTRITASAGAGKTGVTTGRVVKCLLTKGVDPRNIVVCAYNEDAAAVLSARIPDLIAQRVGATDGLAEMFIGTLHSFCLGILQDECYRFRKHSVLSEVANRLLVSRYPCEAGLEAVRYIGGKKKGQGLSGEPNEVRAYLDTLNVLREERVSRGDSLRACAMPSTTTTDCWTQRGSWITPESKSRFCSLSLTSPTPTMLRSKDGSLHASSTC